MDDPVLSPSPYELVFQGLSLIPLPHYLFALFLLWCVFFYNFIEFHFLGDTILRYFRCRVNLTYNPDSPIYHAVVSRCRIFHGRYVATPWLASPHIQTCFLNFHGLPPVFSYRRQLFKISDGGTIALDWLTNADVLNGSLQIQNEVSKEDSTPIAIVVPGLTSDSSSAYLKHLAYGTAKSGWNVVISNHRGLGGVSVTSDHFYNAGWTEDVRVVIGYLREKYPDAPLFAIGTSIGANILVKYLGEEGEKTPLAGAVAICSPWDLLIGDRFISRRFKQKLYDRALTIGLQGYAQLHEPQYTRLANWEGIKQSRSIRDFDNHATCHVTKYETVDTFYRKCSSAQYVGNVAVPLLCVSALDDPLCTKEAIPWDECRKNKNIVLATTKHGGHLAFFEGLTGSSLWWVRATNEFLGALSRSRYMHVQKIEEKRLSGSGDKEPSINEGPYLNMTEDGMVAAVNYEKEDANISEEASSQSGPKHGDDVRKRTFKELCRQTKKSVWWVGYISVVTGFPLLGLVLNYLFRNRKKQRLTISKS